MWQQWVILDVRSWQLRLRHWPSISWKMVCYRLPSISLTCLPRLLWHAYSPHPPRFQGAFDDAIVEFDKCLQLYRKIDPTSRDVAMTLFFLGISNLNAAKFDEAEESFKDAISNMNLHKDKW